MKLRHVLLSAAAMPLLQPAAAVAQQGGTVLPDLVVTASPLDQTVGETATPVINLTGDALVRRRAATLGATLEGQPGVSFDNFGSGASRPVIRGQTAPRVKVMSDGSDVHDASAISPDHTVVTEPLLLRGVEVLRGPGALLYGGGAIGGAVNLLDSKIPTAIPERGASGEAEFRYGTADDERAFVGGVTVGMRNFALRVEGVHRGTDDYRVPDEFGERHVAGSYNDTSTVSVGGSWVGSDGYLGAAWTRQRNQYGLPGHNHSYEDCHPHGLTLHCGSHEDEDEHAEEEGHDHEAAAGIPFIKLRSERFDVRGEYRNPMPWIERARLRMSYTDYAHDEIEGDAVATTFLNKAYDIRTELKHQPIAGFSGVFGMQYGHSRFSALGEEAFLPESRTRNFGIFAMETMRLGPVRFELAARQDWQKIDVDVADDPSHAPFSVSGAAIWEIDPSYSVALTLARTQRAPNNQELFADGIHLATNTFELGNADLAKETTLSVDLTFRKRKGDTTFSVGVYYQDYDDYIFAETLDQFEAFRLIRYTAADATFTGVDGEVRYEFAPGFGAAVFGDYVRAKLKDDGGNVPRIPAGRLGTRLDGQWGAFSGDIEYYHVFEQSKIAGFESVTGGYEMVNLTAAYELPVEAARTEVYLRATNLANELAFNHASFIKDASPLRGRSFLIGLRAAF
ncbi:MAG: TonB-dependent receptor [Rhodospirillales bacterium]